MVQKKKGKCLGMVGMGYLFGEPKRKRTKKARTRTSKTHTHKLNQLKRKYRKLYNNSIKSKDINKKKNYFFCDEYPTVESYLSNFKLKEVGK